MVRFKSVASLAVTGAIHKHPQRTLEVMLFYLPAPGVTYSMNTRLEALPYVASKNKENLARLAPVY
jgi:hypothetical protein